MLRATADAPGSIIHPHQYLDCHDDTTGPERDVSPRDRIAHAWAGRAPSRGARGQSSAAVPQPPVSIPGAVKVGDGWTCSASAREVAPSSPIRFPLSAMKRYAPLFPKASATRSPSQMLLSPSCKCVSVVCCARAESSAPAGSSPRLLPKRSRCSRKWQLRRPSSRLRSARTRGRSNLTLLKFSDVRWL
eukprot:3260094-Rhodomonas_salina.1